MPAPVFRTMTRTCSPPLRLHPAPRPCRPRAPPRSAFSIRFVNTSPSRNGSPHTGRHRIGVAALDRRAAGRAGPSPPARRAPPARTPPAASRARAATGSAGSPRDGPGGRRLQHALDVLRAAGRRAARSASSSSRSPRMVASGVRISWATRAAMPPRKASWSARRISSRMRCFSVASRNTSTWRGRSPRPVPALGGDLEEQGVPLGRHDRAPRSSCTGSSPAASSSRSRASGAFALESGKTPAADRIGFAAIALEGRSEQRLRGGVERDAGCPRDRGGACPRAAAARMSLSRTKRSMERVEPSRARRRGLPARPARSSSRSVRSPRRDATTAPRPSRRCPGCGRRS